MEQPEAMGDAERLKALRALIFKNRVAGIFRRWPVLSVLSLLILLSLIALLPLPFQEIRNLRTTNPASTAFMKEHEAAAREKGKPFRKTQIWVPLHKLPKSLIDAVVVAEDGTFWAHSGFDWFEFKESVERNIEKGRAVRGASTITQQLVKNLFLSSSKNPLRKVREWILTWYMEMTLTKSRILELYLNVIEWGDGIYGAEAAARHYFGTSAEQLSLDETTRLAAVIPNPKRYRPNENSPYVVRRAALVLQRMKMRNMVRADSSAVVYDSLKFMHDTPIAQPDSVDFQEEL